MTAIVSEKGQVTIPKKLRDQLGLKPGISLEFETHDGKLIARKKLVEDVFEKWCGRGRLPTGINTDEYLKLIRNGDGN